MSSKPCSRDFDNPLSWEWEHDWGSIMVQDGETGEDEDRFDREEEDQEGETKAEEFQDGENEED